MPYLIMTMVVNDTYHLKEYINLITHPFMASQIISLKIVS
jgi:hypothetical protein